MRAPTLSLIIMSSITGSISAAMYGSSAAMYGSDHSDSDCGMFVAEDAPAPPRPGAAGQGDASTPAGSLSTPIGRLLAQGRGGTQPSSDSESTRTPHQSMQGRHHANRGSRLTHAEYAARALEIASENKTGVPCIAGKCAFDRRCGFHITPALLLAAATREYGSRGGRTEDGTPFCDPACPEKESLRQKRALVLSWFCKSASGSGVVTETYMVEGHGPVCAEFAKAAYHVGTNTFNRYHALARAGRLQLENDTVALSGLHTELSRPPDDQVQFETTQWWVVWLRLEDQAPNEPFVFYRVVVWQSVHLLEYTPDMQWWGSTAPLSRSRWTELRSEGLKLLSVELFCQVSDCDRSDPRLSKDQVELMLSGGGVGVPVVMLGLRERTKKSNFGTCVGCDTSKALWAQYRTGGNRTRGNGVEVKRIIFKHLAEVKAER